MSQKTKKYRQIILCILTCTIPFIIAYLLLRLEGKTFSDVIPVWGDEVWWWQQANAVGKYGRPLGYWGYNGGHASLGTFATWGPAAVIPYGLFAFLFGWEYHTYIYANCFYMSIATAIFLYASKPDKKSLVALMLVNTVQVVRNYYLVTAMQETMRYSIGLVAIALLILLIQNENRIHWAVKYILIPIYLLLSTWAFLPHIIFVFAYFLILYKKLNILNIFMAGTETLVITVAMRKFMRLFSSPYTSSAKSFRTRIVSNIKVAVKVLLSDKTDLFFKWYHAVYWGMIFFLTLYLLCNWKKLKPRDKILIICADTILTVYQAGWIGFYNTTLWTYTRGISVGLLMATFILCLCHKKTPVIVFLLLSCVGIPCMDNIENTFLNNRFKTPQWEATIENTSNTLEEVLVLDEDSLDPWVNTVQTYSTNSSENKRYVTLCLPVGFSANSMMDKQIRGNAKWIILEKPNDIVETNEWEKFCKLGYMCCFDDTHLMIFRKE